MLTSIKTLSQVCCVKGCGGIIAEYNFCAVHLHYSDVQVRNPVGKVLDEITVQKDRGTSRSIYYNGKVYQLQVDGHGLYIVENNIHPLMVEVMYGIGMPI